MKPLRPGSRGGPCTRSLFRRPIFICIYSPSPCALLPLLQSIGMERGPDGNRFQRAACCRCHDPKKRDVLEKMASRERLDLTLILPVAAAAVSRLPCFSFRNADAFSVLD